MTHTRTCLSDKHLEMMVILRINREFIEFMNLYFPEVAYELTKQSEEELKQSILESCRAASKVPTAAQTTLDGHFGPR